MAIQTLSDLLFVPALRCWSLHVGITVPGVEISGRQFDGRHVFLKSDRRPSYPNLCEQSLLTSYPHSLVGSDEMLCVDKSYKTAPYSLAICGCQMLTLTP
jgi:hypothetical protein